MENEMDGHVACMEEMWNAYKICLENLKGVSWKI
jgi:hypothetical protein